MAGIKAGGVAPADVPVYESETAALRAELNGRGPDSPRVIVLMCHEQREAVFALLDELGARPVDITEESARRSFPASRSRPRRG